jgi:hypothetical protein
MEFLCLSIVVNTPSNSHIRIEKQTVGDKGANKHPVFVAVVTAKTIVITDFVIAILFFIKTLKKSAIQKGYLFEQMNNFLLRLLKICFTIIVSK